MRVGVIILKIIVVPTRKTYTANDVIRTFVLSAKLVTRWVAASGNVSSYKSTQYREQLRLETDPR